MFSVERTSISKSLQLLRFANIKPGYICIPVVFSLAAAVFEGAGLGVLLSVVEGFLTKSSASAINTPILKDILALLPDSILLNDRYLFSVLLGLFVGLLVTKNIVRYIATVSMAYFGERTLHHVRKALFARYLQFGKLFFDTTNVGHHNTILLEYTMRALKPLITIDKYVNAFFSLLVYVVMLFVISWKLTLIALPLFVVLHTVVKVLIVHIRKLSRAIAERGSDLGKKSVEILSTMPLIKAYAAEGYERDLYTGISDEKAALDFKVRSLQALIFPTQEILTMIVGAGIFVGMFWIFGQEDIASTSSLIVYFYIVLNASSKFGTLSGFFGVLATSSGPLDDVLEIFHDEKKWFVRGGDKTFSGVDTAIRCEHLSFAYGDDRSVLKDVSFEIPRGSMTAIVGPTGSGKSTLINLLMRYYDCPAGTLFVDSTDIREFTLQSYLKNIALVSQETLLLHESLRYNITYGLGEVSDDDVNDAVERARLGEFVSSLPEGLETRVGDRGVKLSGGEKQRVSIARALLKGAEILILDEATSSLDTKTERLIQEAIDEAVKDRTAIVIAHRLSTIQHADAIIVLEKGTLKEKGTLDELLEKKGTFFELWQEQKF